MDDYVREFITRFGMWLDAADPQARQKFTDHVYIYIDEEYKELRKAADNGDTEEIIDALGDISWLCDKALLIAGISPEQVRREIGEANLAKIRGIKPGREDAVMDVIKPEGWVPPDHAGNHGILDKLFQSPG